MEYYSEASDENSLVFDKLQSFPLYSLLLAAGNPTVNLLSLDIEGAEFEVLKTIQWSKVNIEVILIELVHAGEVDLKIPHFKNQYYDPL